MQPSDRWGTQTFIAGLIADATIAPWAIQGAMDGLGLAAYVEKVPVLTAQKPRLEPHGDGLLQTQGPPPAASEHASSQTCPMPLPKSANSAPRKSARTTSRLTDMSQVKARCFNPLRMTSWRRHRIHRHAWRLHIVSTFASRAANEPTGTEALDF